jgi:hypothetical protein
MKNLLITFIIALLATFGSEAKAFAYETVFESEGTVEIVSTKNYNLIRKYIRFIEATKKSILEIVKKIFHSVMNMVKLLFKRWFY